MIEIKSIPKIYIQHTFQHYVLSFLFFAGGGVIFFLNLSNIFDVEDEDKLNDE